MENNLILHQELKFRNKFFFEENRISITDLRRIVSKYPKCVSTADSNGYLPIHIAVIYEYDIEFLGVLVDFYPECLNFRSSSGNLPIHIACDNIRNQELIKFLATRSPHSLSKRDMSGCLPVHSMSCLHNSPLVPFLVKLNPVSVKCDSKLGLPVTVACNFTNNEKSISYLAKCYPEGLTVMFEGQLPIHRILKKYPTDKKLEELIRLLVQLSPESVHYADFRQLNALDIALNRFGSGGLLYRVILNSSPSSITDIDHINNYKNINFNARFPLILITSKLLRSSYALEYEVPRLNVLTEISKPFKYRKGRSKKLKNVNIRDIIDNNSQEFIALLMIMSYM